MVRVVRTTSLDDMYSENIWFSCYKPSKYREKLICYACDGGGRTNGKWKIVQCSVGPETAIFLKKKQFFFFTASLSWRVYFPARIVLNTRNE